MDLRIDEARALYRAGNFARAEQVLRGVLGATPESAEALDLLGASLGALGRLDEAIAAYRKALSLDPSLWAAHNDLGNALRERGLRAEALEHYAAAARLAPESMDAVSNYAAALRESGRVQDAIAVLEAALQRWPDSPEVLGYVGALYYDAKRFDEAERHLRRALERAPDMLGARINLGNLFAVQGRLDESIEMYRSVVARNPSIADVQSNLGIALQEKGDLQGAIACFEKAVAAQPEHAEALNNLGYARLASREFAEGWRLVEWRFAAVPLVAVDRAFSIPRLTPENLRGARKVAIWSEQGIGDQILCGTMIPDLAKLSVPFVLEVDSRLVTAFRRAHPDWEVVGLEESGAAFAACDRHIPIASLGAILRPDLESFAGQPRALLVADRERARSMRESLRSEGRRIVGISWRSFQPNIRAIVERRKSAALADFLDLSRREDVILLDLQYGDTEEERSRFAAQGGRLARIAGLDLFGDIEGVLAAVEACDLVITTSNVTAHFAGALGKDARLVYPAGVPPFHYWATDETGRCLWYPSIRIVTGPDLRAWPDLIAEAAGPAQARVLNSR